ncbi:hypothetical protein DUT91_05760 [Phyllobacterium salinisoli]|uniref:Lipoprotein n=1 Tax=Phyllobacterium salinisoli TaxID=1899321 RepID=A0A368K6U2_9HYPH|nr:hypothetical protein [Phyllobacterium salinisoli]RCS24951.1 hypothetical protein DUT91_05760 [Phyllobacterium salinisoli]
MKIALFLIPIAVPVVAALAGCAGINYVSQKYAGQPSVEYRAKDGTTYRIVDNRREERLMIGPSISSSATDGFIKGLSLGSGIGATPPVVSRDAAEEYLASTGRKCESRDITLVVDPYYEVRYSCSSTLYRRGRTEPLAQPTTTGALPGTLL